MTVDRKQRNKAFPEIFGVGVCIAIPPVGPSPVPVGVPKTGFMIESMVTATGPKYRRALRGEGAEGRGHLECRVPRPISATRASPSSPSRRFRRATSTGRPRMWVHLAKVAYEKYFLRKMRRGERAVL